MSRHDGTKATAGWTRGDLLKAGLGGGAAVAGASFVSARSGSSASADKPSAATDAQILNLFLVLERVQEAFYREAVGSRRLSGELRGFAQVVGDQERAHVAFLARNLGSRGRRSPKSDFGA